MPKVKEEVPIIKFSDAVRAIDATRGEILRLTMGLTFQIETIQSFIDGKGSKAAADLALRQIKDAYNGLKPYLYA